MKNLKLLIVLLVTTFAISNVNGQCFDQNYSPVSHVMAKYVHLPFCASPNISFPADNGTAGVTYKAEVFDFVNGNYYAVDTDLSDGLEHTFTRPGDKLFIRVQKFVNNQPNCYEYFEYIESFTAGDNFSADWDIAYNPFINQADVNLTEFLGENIKVVINEFIVGSYINLTLGDIQQMENDLPGLQSGLYLVQVIHDGQMSQIEHYINCTSTVVVQAGCTVTPTCNEPGIDNGTITLNGINPQYQDSYGKFKVQLYNSQNDLIETVLFTTYSSPDYIFENLPASTYYMVIADLYEFKWALHSNITVTENANACPCDSGLITQLQSENALLQQQLATANAQVTSLQQQLATANAQVTSLQQQLAAANAQVTSLQQQLATANAQVTSLQQQLATANALVTSLQNENTTLQQQLAAANALVTSLQNENTTLQQQLAAANALVTSLQNENSQLLQQIQVMSITVNVNSTTTSTVEVQESDIEIYPNPAVNYIKFDFGNSIEVLQNYEVSLYNMQGQLLQTVSIGGDQEIDISFLTSGTYVVKLVDDTNQSVKIGRVIKP